MHHSSSEPPPVPLPSVVPRGEHSVSRSLIDSDAMKVLYRLNRHGHTAYLVGGGVRDLLLGRTPKDFDISTSAHPHEIRKLFGNCRLIGRRFRLAHIYFRGGKIIEVSTFRTISEFDMEDGPIASDNTFGTPWEDAFRRDFTINALFYNITDFSVLDYVGGMTDLENGVIRCLGDPAVRFREDPIRMLRGIRFASLLGFNLDEESAHVIRTTREEIWKGGMPRILEETLKMLGRGAGRRAFVLLEDLGLLQTLLPEIQDHISREGSASYLDLLDHLDARFSAGGDFEPWLILSGLLYPYFDFSVRSSGNTDLVHLTRDVVSGVCSHLQVPRKIQDRMRQVLAAQVRLFALGTARFRPQTLLRKSYFTDAFRLFEIIAVTSTKGRKLVSDWKTLIDGSNRKAPPERRSRRRRKRGQGKAKPPSTG